MNLIRQKYYAHKVLHYHSSYFKDAYLYDFLFQALQSIHKFRILAIRKIQPLLVFQLDIRW